MKTYDVILNFGPDSAYGGFFKNFATNVIVQGNGNKLFLLECTQVDESAHYLVVSLSEKSTLAGFPLRIPHHMVLAIVDAPLSEKVVGFGSLQNTSENSG